MPIKVAIVEDDAEIRSSLVELVSRSQICSLAEVCRNAAEALEKLPLRPPNVVLMDVNMPGMNGVECVRRLKLILPNVNILMLTVYEDGDWLFESLKAGASGYLLKRTTSVRLIEAIQEVNAGGAPMTPEIAKRVVRYFSSAVNPRPANEPERDELSSLTSKQMEVLKLLAAGYAYKEIADKMGFSVDGARSYVRKIYEKLHVHSRLDAAMKLLKKQPANNS